LRERQVAEAKHLEIAKLEIAKREGRESLSEADLARIKNERLRTENLARVARVSLGAPCMIKLLGLDAERWFFPSNSILRIMLSEKICVR
jgi:hypothetical protein